MLEIENGQLEQQIKLLMRQNQVLREQSASPDATLPVNTPESKSNYKTSGDLLEIIQKYGLTD